MQILNSIKNDEARTEVYIFDRAAVDAKMPFGVRFLDTDANETITIIFCPTFDLAQKKMADLTKAPATSWVSV